MRALFLLLLLANVAFLGWNWYQERALGHRVAAPPSTAGEGRGLRLLADIPAERLRPIRKDAGTEAPAAASKPERSARPAPTETAEVATPKEPPPAAGPRRCFRAGQIQARADRDRLLQWLEERGIEGRSGTEKGHGESHWVLLPPFGSEDRARKVMGRLREKGIEDLYLVPSGDNRNAVSLGVFKERPRADQRLARIRRLGFEAEMRNLPLPSTRYWVRFRWPADRGEPPLEKLAEVAGGKPEQVDCP